LVPICKHNAITRQSTEFNQLMLKGLINVAPTTTGTPAAGNVLGRAARTQR
jgi:hypothetical protein